MLGLQYVVSKSRELSSALDRELQASRSSSSAPSAAPAPPSSARNEGAAFLEAQQTQATERHQQLLQRGQELSAALTQARSKLQQQAASEQFLTQNFHLVQSVKQQLAAVRRLVVKVAEDAEDVENLLLQRCEESAARQNAQFAAQQQQELEAFEASIATESESRKRELLQMRRQKLASAFYNDLRTYQALVEHHGDGAAKEAAHVETAEKETLDSVELVVTADPEQLAAFYESGSEEEADEQHTPKFAGPKELMEEEEEKSEDKAEREGDGEEVTPAGDEQDEEETKADEEPSKQKGVGSPVEETEDGREEDSDSKLPAASEDEQQAE